MNKQFNPENPIFRNYKTFLPSLDLKASQSDSPVLSYKL